MRSVHTRPGLLLCLLFLAGCGCDGGAPPPADATTSPAGAGLVFTTAGDRPYFHDFGERLWGERIEHVFRLENREGRAVLVKDLLPDCGCTSPRAAYVGADGVRVEGPARTQGVDLSVPAGATLEVAVALDTTRVERPNQHKLAQVRVRSDSAATPFLTLELHVLVKRAFRSVPAEIVMAEVPQSFGKSARADVSTELRGDGSRIRGVEAIEGPFQAALEERQVAGETLWILTVSADPGLTTGPHSGKVVLGTTRADGEGTGQPFSVPVRAQVVADCVVRPNMLQVRREEGEARAELVALAPGARVRVTAARVEGAHAAALEVAWDPVGPDDEGRAPSWRLALRPRGDWPAGAFAGRVVIELDDPALPRVEVAYAAAAR